RRVSGRIMATARLRGMFWPMVRNCWTVMSDDWAWAVGAVANSAAEARGAAMRAGTKRDMGREMRPPTPPCKCGRRSGRAGITFAHPFADGLVVANVAPRGGDGVEAGQGLLCRQADLAFGDAGGGATAGGPGGGLIAAHGLEGPAYLIHQPPRVRPQQGGRIARDAVGRGQELLNRHGGGGSRQGGQRQGGDDGECSGFHGFPLEGRGSLTCRLRRNHARRTPSCIKFLSGAAAAMPAAPDETG